MKSGFVSIVGRPNVGKSTLLNTLLERKLAITDKMLENLVLDPTTGETNMIDLGPTPYLGDAEGNNIVINGAIVTYGADPTSYSPGSGGGLGSLSDKDMLNISKFGNIEIYNCRDFSIVYDSSDLAAFVNKISDKPINLSGIYSNKL